MVAIAALMLLMATAITPVNATVIKSPPWADIFGAKWPGASGLDTRGSMNAAKTQLSEIGYYAISSTNMTAPSSMNTSQAQADAVWAAFGHGNGGVMEFHAMGAVSTTWLFASSGIWSGYGCGSPNDCISDYPSPKISRMKLMFFGGCLTATSDSTGSTYDNLLDAARGVGVDNALGFAANISWPSMDMWTERFFDQLSRGGTLANSAEDASILVGATYGSYMGTKSLVIDGNANAVIKPAAYGS